MKDKILKLLEIILILVVVFSGGMCCVDIMQNYHPEFTRNENAMPYTITNTTTTNNPENAKREDAIGSLRCDAAGLAIIPFLVTIMFSFLLKLTETQFLWNIR